MYYTQKLRALANIGNKNNHGRNHQHNIYIITFNITMTLDQLQAKAARLKKWKAQLEVIIFQTEQKIVQEQLKDGKK